MIATVRAEVALLNQNLAEAQTIIDQAFALGLDDEEKGIALRLRGQILAQLGQIQEASAAYTQSTRILKETMRFEYMRTRVAQAELQLSQNQDAKPILEDALRAFTEMSAPREIRKVKTLLQAV